MDYRFNHALQNMPPSASMAVNELAKKMKQEGIPVVNLSAGEPDFDTPDKARMTGIAAIASGHTHYAEARGILPLRERIAAKLRQENGIDCTAANILVAPGGKYAIYETVASFITAGRDDEVMILCPAWVSYVPIVLATGGVPVMVELDDENDYRITREKLEQSYSEKTRMLIINYPNNPTGCILSQEEAEIIADFACEHQVMVLSDEIYETLTFDGRKSVSVGSIQRAADYVITVNGFSKSVAMTGWRIGYICAPEPVVNQILLLTQHTISCLSPFTMEAALISLDCTEDIRMMQARYQQRRDFFVPGLNAIPGVHCHMPEGAFYAWVKIDLGGMSGAEVAAYLLEKAHVATVPGEAFGNKKGAYVRMSFATADDQLQQALVQLEDAIRNYPG